jgi:thiamine-phosphate pyrophosphorylase
VTALMGLDARLRLARLYLCTDARQQQGDLADFLAAAFAGGVDIVQIRQNGMARNDELAALEIARRAAEPYQGIVCVNDSAEIAGAFKADMLHLGQQRGPASAARKPLHPWALIGRSTHETGQADRAIRDRDVDYFWVGPVYSSSSRPGERAGGLELIRYAAKRAPVARIESKPWFAIGSISRDNIDEVIAAGARRVCVVRAITEAPDPEKAARELHARVQAAWHADPAMQSYVFQAASSTGRTR